MGRLADLPRAPTLLVLCLLLDWASLSFQAASFGLRIHHRFSDPVKALFTSREGEFLPEEGTADYFTVLAERDRIQGRRLTSAADDYHPPLTFVAGNSTYRLNQLGFLYYANVSVGTPAMDFLVALDTGSDYFWLPCDCISCVTAIKFEDDSVIKLNIYNLNTSSTGTKVPCSSPMCEHKDSCSQANQCPYRVRYLSGNTSSSGYLVNDVLHLTTDSNPSKPANPKVTFGCGQRQDGSFLTGGAPNGLFGLGMDKISVPSILASQNLIANSFSMCFGHEEIGRISFGDMGSSKQRETPFSLEKTHPTYNVSITQIAIGKIEKDVDASAICDSGTSFTVLKDPAYSLVTENFNSQVNEKRVEVPSDFPFEYCYSLSSCKAEVDLPTVSLTFKGDAQFSALHPTKIVMQERNCFYCLAVLKNNLVNIIGQNFMTGYRMVFNREKMVLGWEESDCNYEFETNISPMSPQISPAVSANLHPEATPAQSSGISESRAASTMDYLTGRLNLWTFALIFLCLMRL